MCSFTIVVNACFDDTMPLLYSNLKTLLISNLNHFCFQILVGRLYLKFCILQKTLKSCSFKKNEYVVLMSTLL